MEHLVDLTAAQHYEMDVAMGQPKFKNPPTHIVVHAMAEYVRWGRMPVHAVDFFKARTECAHTLITPSGVVLRTLGTDRVAWHCRAQGMNWKSLGIEFLMPGVHDLTSLHRDLEHHTWNDRQIDAGAWEIAHWCRNFNIPWTNVFSHEHLDSRKKDPGLMFPWAALDMQVEARLEEFKNG